MITFLGRQKQVGRVGRELGEKRIQNIAPSVKFFLLT